MKLLAYSEHNLAKELANNLTPQSVIEGKNQFHYLKDYFGAGGLKAQTIIVEEHYISKDYVNDFSSYYASCFNDYPKCCKRLHFFAASFSKEDFKKALTEDSPCPEIWDNYLGNIVVKPLPITIIGTTVLKNYDKGDKIGERNFWGTRDYTIHLWGKKLILDSLAFQEQDTVLSACATTAIWSMLHKASEDYSIVLKTPGEITIDAGETTLNKGRLLPNKDGLEVIQMIKAIENTGLDTEIRIPTEKKPQIENRYLKKILNAYSPIGLPIILVVKVPHGFKDPKAKSRDVPTNIGYGYHSITVSGFTKKSLSTLNAFTERKSIYDLIEKIYCHDDQWGPFARVEFVGNHELVTSWSNCHASGIKPATFVEAIIIPVFSKIRISYDDVEPLVAAISEIIKQSFKDLLPDGFVWDIRVMYSETLKGEVIKDKELDSTEKLNFLTTSFPKYIWVATCYSKEHRLADFVFDATDISNGMTGIKVLSYFSPLKKYLYDSLTQNPAYKNYFQHSLKDKYFDFLVEELK